MVAYYGGDLNYQAMLQQQQNAQLANAGLTSGLYGGLQGVYTVANTAGTGALTTNIVYCNGEVYAPTPTVVAKPDDEFTWLRKRVDDVCWKHAA